MPSISQKEHWKTVRTQSRHREIGSICINAEIPLNKRANMALYRLPDYQILVQEKKRKIDF